MREFDTKKLFDTEDPENNFGPVVVAIIVALLVSFVALAASIPHLY